MMECRGFGCYGSLNCLLYLWVLQNWNSFPFTVSCRGKLIFRVLLFSDSTCQDKTWRLTMDQRGIFLWFLFGTAGQRSSAVKGTCGLMLAKLHTWPTVKAEPELLPLTLLPLISLPTHSVSDVAGTRLQSLGTCAEMLFDSPLQMTANIYTYKDENKKSVA